MYNLTVKSRERVGSWPLFMKSTVGGNRLENDNPALLPYSSSAAGKALDGGR